MNFWDVLTYVAWSLSAIMLVWMVVDAFMVSSQYDEEFLMSSREGEDEVMHGVELDGENK
ncbi:MAG: hypothetical protein RL194_1083 [Pseudomonadota bacterium]|jgi:flagellar biosynthesis protein FlhB